MLAGKGLTVTPLSSIMFPASGSSSGTGGSRPVSIASAVSLDLVTHPTGSLAGPACA